MYSDLFFAVLIDMKVFRQVLGSWEVILEVDVHLQRAFVMYVPLVAVVFLIEETMIHYVEIVNHNIVCNVWKQHGKTKNLTDSGMWQAHVGG